MNKNNFVLHHLYKHKEVRHRLTSKPFLSTKNKLSVVDSKSSNHQRLSKDLTLVLNFKRLKFFPYIYSKKENIFFSGSLGLMSNRINKGRCLKTKKISYLGLSKMIRRIILHSYSREYDLIIRRVPKYFSEILSTLNTSSINSYLNPINSAKFYEPTSVSVPLIKPSYIYFSKSLNYSYRKVKKKGRLKRKISSRLVTSNRVID